VRESCGKNVDIYKCGNVIYIVDTYEYFALEYPSSKMRVFVCLCACERDCVWVSHNSLELRQ